MKLEIAFSLLLLLVFAVATASTTTAPTTAGLTTTVATAAGLTTTVATAAGLTTTVATAVLGQACPPNGTANCSVVANSICLPNEDGPSTCSCDYDYKESSSSCIPKTLGDGCDRQREDEDCKHVPNAKCLPDPKAPANQIDLKCLCPFVFKYKAEHKACEKRLSQVTLVNGGKPYKGRIEMKWNGMWGTVASNNFGSKEAQVFCRAMGMSGGIVRGSMYGKGSENITVWLQNIKCAGTEEYPDDCLHDGFGSCHGCTHEKDASIECKETKIHEMYRLADVGNNGPYKGRVEVFHNGAWGTVCDDGFNDLAANIFCKSIGYSGGRKWENKQGAGGTGNIWLDDLHCEEPHEYLHQCDHNGYGNTNCRHDEDVYVHCEYSDSRYANTLSQGLTRLVGGQSALVGRLEMWNNGSWGTVCPNNYKAAGHYLNVSKVVCSSLGYDVGGEGTYASSRYGSYDGQINIGNVMCDQSEAKIQDCQYTEYDNHADTSICSLLKHKMDIVITCNHTAYTKVDFRLADGPKGKELSQGRVELGIRGEWGSVCETGWTEKSVSELCGKLGQSDIGGTIVRRPKNGLRSWLIWESSGKCQGSNKNPLECGWAVSECKDENELNIQCLSKEAAEVKYRVVDYYGTPKKGGYLEVRYNGEWGYVCVDNFSLKARKVACTSSGYNSTKETPNRWRYHRGSKLAWMTNVQCKGGEKVLHECDFPGWGKVDSACRTIVGIDCN